MQGLNGEAARAKLHLAAVNKAIIKRAGARRQGLISKARGDRAPASIAPARVDLASITEPRPGGGVSPVTPLGYKTARRALPRALAVLSENDGRRRAALFISDAAERVGSIGGGDLGGAGHKGEISDGGVTTKIKHSTRLRMALAVANGWPIDAAHGKVSQGVARVVMPVVRQRGNAKEITATSLLWMLCVDGCELTEILERHGRGVNNRTLKALAAIAFDVLEDVADRLVL